MKKYNEEILQTIEEIKDAFNEPLKIINKGTQEYNYIYDSVHNIYDGLGSCYGSYSYYKERAYEKYLDIYRKLIYYKGFAWEGFGINSYNSNMFTLCMELRKNKINYKIYITKSYNRIIAYTDEED